VAQRGLPVPIDAVGRLRRRGRGGDHADGERRADRPAEAGVDVLAHGCSLEFVSAARCDLGADGAPQRYSGA
jgi:hypothetical protein